MAAFFQHEERPLLCVATDEVEDHIDLLLQNLLELRLSIIASTLRVTAENSRSAGIVLAILRRRHLQLVPLFRTVRFRPRQHRVEYRPSIERQRGHEPYTVPRQQFANRQLLVIVAFD